MAKKQNGETKGTAAVGGTVRMRAPKGTAAVGVPMGDEVVQVKVPKGGLVDVDGSLVEKLVEAGFTPVQEKPED